VQCPITYRATGHSDLVVQVSGVKTAALPVTLTVTKGGPGQGTVSSSPAGIACGAVCAGSFPASATVALTATPAAGSTFAGWGGACTGTGACSVALTTAKSVTATFTLTADQPPTGSLSLTGTKVCTVTVTVVAQDDKGVASVQLKINGANNGAADTVPPYTFARSAVVHGSQISAEIKDSAGQKTTVGPATLVCP